MKPVTHTIDITITPAGKIVGEVKGVSGPACAPLSEWLDELGAVVEDRQTADYRKPSTQGISQNSSK